MNILFIQLPAHRQVSRIRPELIKEVEDEIHAFMEDTGSTHISSGEGTWILELRSAKSQGGDGPSQRRRLFGERFLALYRHFDDIERELQGYNLVIDNEDSVQLPASLDRLRTLALQSGADRHAWISITARPFFDDLFESTDGIICRISGLVSAADSTGPPIADFFVRSAVVEELHADIQSVYFGSGEERCIVLETDGSDGGSASLERCLTRLGEQIDELFWMKSGSQPDPQASPFAALGLAVHEEIFSPLDYLGETERVVWESLLGIDDSVGDRIAIDFYQLLALYLHAYERRMAEFLLPAVWVVFARGLQPKWLEEVCFRHINNLQADSGLVPVVVVDDAADVAGLLSVSSKLVRVPALAPEEIRTRQEQFAIQDGAQHEIGAGIAEENLRSYYHRYQLSVRRGNVNADDPAQELIQSLGPDQRKYIKLRREYGRITGNTLIHDYLVDSGSDHESVTAALELLEEWQLADTPVIARGEPQDEDETMGVARFLTARFSEEKLKTTNSIVKFVWNAGLFPDAADMMHKHVIRLVEAERLETANSLFQEMEAESGSNGDPITMECLKLRTAIQGGASAAASRGFTNLKALPAARATEIEGSRLLEYARYYYFKGSYQEGLQSSKDALILFQQEYPIREAEACIFVALHMLAASKIDEAEAYLGIARENSTDMSPTLSVISGMYAAITQFVRGNLSRSLRICTETRDAARGAGMRRYQLFLHFLIVRIQMELGRYDLCVELCTEGLTLSALYEDRAQEIFRRWLRKNQAYSGNLKEAEAGLDPDSLNPEEMLFLSEVYLLQERFEKAADCIARASSAALTARNGAAEVVDWHNGFAMIEDRAMRGPDGTTVLGALVRSFRAYTGCFQNQERVALDELSRITRDELFSPIDPNNGLYHYQYAHAIRCVSGAGDLDRLTALSKAMKFIQERAANIDDAGEKQAYLHGNYWNNRILSDARESKLI